MSILRNPLDALDQVTAERDAAAAMAGRLATLGHLAGLVTTSLDPRQVFAFVAEATSRLLDGAAALLLLADETGEVVTICASHGLGRVEFRAQDRFRRGEGLVGWVFERREPLILTEMLRDPRTLNRTWMEAEGLRAFAGVPILLRGQCLGVLCVMRRGVQPIAPTDVDLLVAFATHAAAAIRNARLFEKTAAEGHRLRALIEAMPEAVVVAEGRPGESQIRLIMANRARAALLRTSDLVPGARTNYYQLFRAGGAPLEDAELPLQRAVWQGEATTGMEIVVRFPDGSQRDLLASATSLPEAEGTRRAVEVLQDITERKRAERALAESERRFRLLAENAPDIIYAYRFLPTRGFEYVSPSATRVTGYSPVEHYADPDLGLKLVHPDDRPLLEAFMRDPAAFAGPLVLRWIRKDGTLLWTEQVNRPIYDDAGDLVAVEGIGRDITQRKRAEEALRLSEERFRRIADSNIIGIAFWELDGRIIEANQAFLEIIGYPRAELLSGQLDWRRITPLEYAQADRRAVQQLRERGTCTPYEKEYLRPDGRRIPVLVGSAFLEGSDHEGVAFVLDLTERKRLQHRAEFEASRLRAVMDMTPEILLILEAGTGMVVQANRAALEVLGAAPLVGARPPDLGFRLLPEGGGRELPASEWPSQRACLGEHIRGEQVILELPGGERIHYLVSAAPILGAQGRPSQAVLVAADISILKRTENDLAQLAEENRILYGRAAREAQVKGLLLEELNHRVRNNLALIVSFLELQQESQEGRAAAPVLEEAIARVEGLARVHNVLAEAGFEAGEYAALVAGLAEQTLLQGAAAGRVGVRLGDVSLRLPSAQLTALGLVTNELFTNIAKHAFPEGRTGNVEVTVEVEGGEARVRVHDDGVGLPPGFAEKPGHLGLKLIRSLVEVSLKGTFALEAGEGTTAIVRFPHPGEEARGGESDGRDRAEAGWQRAEVRGGEGGGGPTARAHRGG